jgi:DNA-binding PadR family transcriptional regulator
MKHRHTGGEGRRFSHSDHGDHAPHEGHHHRSRHGHHRGGRRDGRPFDYGELRLVILGMIAEQPRHGYELIKAIEERMGGSYTPSPGVIYPTLAMLEEMGHASVVTHEAGRKQYTITLEGTAYLTAHREAVDAVFARLDQRAAGEPAGVPPQIVRGMENLKLALRLRLARGVKNAAEAETIASALDGAARAVEGS